MPDPSLLAEVSDDASRVAAAYEGHLALLEYVAWKKFTIPADDVRSLVHDVFLSYLRHRARVRTPHEWLLAAMHKRCCDYWRHRGRAFDAADSLQALRAEADAISERLDLSRVLRELGTRCRESLLLYYLEGYSCSEVAEKLGVTENNAKQIIHRCRNAARQRFVERRRR